MLSRSRCHCRCGGEDLKVARRFYEGTLGFEVGPRAASWSQLAWFKDSDGNNLNVVSR